MKNPFENRAVGLNGPGKDLLPVTPDDVAELSQVALGLYVETGGAVSMVTETGQQRLVTVADFSILPVAVRQVRATGTSATGIHAFVVS